MLYLCHLSCPLFENLCLLGHILPSSEEVPLEASLVVQWLRLHASIAVGVGSISGQRTKILHASHVTTWEGPPLKKRKKEISLGHLGLHNCYSPAIVSSTGGTEGKASLPSVTHSCLFLRPLRTLLYVGYLTPQVYSIVAPEPLPKVTWAVPEQLVPEGFPSQPHTLAKASILCKSGSLLLLPNLNLITMNKASHHSPFR